MTRTATGKLRRVEGNYTKMNGGSEEEDLEKRVEKVSLKEEEQIQVTCLQCQVCFSFAVF